MIHVEQFGWLVAAHRLALFIKFQVKVTVLQRVYVEVPLRRKSPDLSPLAEDQTKAGRPNKRKCLFMSAGERLQAATD